MESDQQAVDTIVGSIINMINQFDLDPEADGRDFIHLASGVSATPDITSNLLKAHKKGDEEMKKYDETRLQKTDVRLNKTLSHLRLKTFADMGKKKRASARKKAKL